MALVGAVLIALAAQPLPTVAQPNAETIATLTRLDLPMKKVLELDGGWCTYVIPRCAWINFAADPVTGDPFTADLGDFAYFDRLRRMVLDGKIDSIVVSAGLIEYLNTRGEILENLTRNSSDWKRHEIGNGRYLLFNRKYVR